MLCHCPLASVVSAKIFFYYYYSFIFIWNAEREGGTEIQKLSICWLTPQTPANSQGRTRLESGAWSSACSRYLLPPGVCVSRMLEAKEERGRAQTQALGCSSHLSGPIERRLDRMPVSWTRLTRPTEAGSRTCQAPVGSECTTPECGGDLCF